MYSLTLELGIMQLLDSPLPGARDLAILVDDVFDVIGKLIAVSL